VRSVVCALALTSIRPSRVLMEQAWMPSIVFTERQLAWFFNYGGARRFLGLED
jgi:hypothetical protein